MQRFAYDFNRQRHKASVTFTTANRNAQFTPPRQTRQDGPVCVLSGGVNRVGPTSAFCVGLRPAVALRRPTHSDTDKTQNAPSHLSVNSHRHTRHVNQNSRVCVVSGMAVWISFKQRRAAEKPAACHTHWDPIASIGTEGVDKTADDNLVWLKAC